MTRMSKRDSKVCRIKQYKTHNLQLLKFRLNFSHLFLDLIGLMAQICLSDSYKNGLNYSVIRYIPIQSAIL